MSSGRFPLVSIITLNYNQTEVTRVFLESARSLTYPHFEILVCDMASATDPTDTLMAGGYPNTRILRSEKNLGFAGGNNWAMRQAAGEFFFVVNNDTVLTPHILEKLLAPFAQNERIAVTCPKIRFYDQPDRIQYAGFNPMNRYTGRTTSIGLEEIDRGQHDRSRPTAGAHGCAMMIRRQALEKTGLFAEKFFLYYEEWDLSTRLREQGYIIWYAAEALIYHKESITVGRNSPMQLYYLTRNRILYMRRHSTAFQFMVFVFLFCTFVIPKTVLYLLVRGQTRQIGGFFRAIWWNLRTSSQSET